MTGSNRTVMEEHRDCDEEEVCEIPGNWVCRIRYTTRSYVEAGLSRLCTSVMAVPKTEKWHDLNLDIIAGIDGRHWPMGAHQCWRFGESLRSAVIWTGDLVVLSWSQCHLKLSLFFDLDPRPH